MAKRKFTEEEIRNCWTSGKPIKYRGIMWNVKRMSYGDYFLEPQSYRGREIDPFHPKTIWLGKRLRKNIYGVSQIFYEAE